MKINSILIAILISILCVSCDWESCENEMEDIRNKHGSPEEINTYSSDNYDSEDWWYWSKGVQYTFEWGVNVEGCEVSKYTFKPINMLNDSSKNLIKNNKKLEWVHFYE